MGAGFNFLDHSISQKSKRDRFLALVNTSNRYRFDGEENVRAASRLGLEGMVSKRLTAHYRWAVEGVGQGEKSEGSGSDAGP